MKQFKVIRAGNTKLNGKIGTLIGDVDYAGCRSGWHTLVFDDGMEAMFTGDEIVEIKN